MSRIQRRRSGGSRTGTRVGAMLGVALVALAASACDLDRILRVEQAGAIDARDLDEPVNAHFLVTGAIADFDCALGAYIVNQGMLGNELRDASFTAARFSLDRRDFTERDPYGTNLCTGSPPGAYTPVAVARATADHALTRLQGWTDAEVADRTFQIARAATYSGYSHVLMGEGFCTAVIENMGPEVPSTAAFSQAVDRFTTAMTAAAALDSTAVLNLAQLGRARARLNLASRGVDPVANYTGAATDAQAVLDRTPTFVKLSTASAASGRRWNRVADEFFGGRITVDPSFRGLMVDGDPDTRVNVVDSGTNGHDSVTPVWLAVKHAATRAAATRTNPIPMATWREAVLIIAEAAAMQDATLGAAETAINVLRTFHGLPQYDRGTDTQAQVLAQVIEERSRELFLEGHHLSDLRRFNLAFLPATGEAYRQGGTYGSNTCFPIPDVERENNPNF